MNTDATTARSNNKNISVRNYSTDKYTLLLATKGKAKKHIDESGILSKYVGNLVHNHETLLYNYGKFIAIRFIYLILNFFLQFALIQLILFHLV